MKLSGITSAPESSRSKILIVIVGKAIDVRTRDKSDAECASFIAKCKILGVVVRDERRRPARQRVWSGAYIHLEIGTNTEASVREFQARNNLVIDGIAGEITLALLNSEKAAAV